MVRRACLHILTCCSACPPLGAILSKRGKKQAKTRQTSQKNRCDKKACRAFVQSDLDRLLEYAMKRQELPRDAANRLRNFLSHGCLPLPANFDEALDALQEASRKLRLRDAAEGKGDTRRSKRFDDVTRGIRSLKQLSIAMRSLGIIPLLESSKNSQKYFDDNADMRLRQPAFILIDLGLRQRRKHINGQLLFQAIMLPDDYFDLYFQYKIENIDTMVASGGCGVKVAEGGRYDDLVRKFRPPGNFGSAQFDQYTAAPIPMCVGIRFFVGKFVERLYLEANLYRNTALASGLDVLRKSLSHPISSTHTVRCIVAGVEGMDAASFGDRAAVAAYLWASGIAAEYMPQSGVMMSLLQQSSSDSNKPNALDWTLDQLCGVCAILKIPFVVIVQPHLLRDKGSVRIRPVLSDSSGVSFQSSGSEDFVALAELPGVLNDKLVSMTFHDNNCPQREQNSQGIGIERQATPGSSLSTRDVHSVPKTNIDCIHVDTYQFYGLDKNADIHKSIRKIMKTVTQKAESYVHEVSGGSNVTCISSDLPFLVLREFGTCIMTKSAKDTFGASVDIIDKYPQHKKILKTLSLALDNLIRHQGIPDNSFKSRGANDGSNRQLSTLNVFMYSIPDDRYDLISLGGGKPKTNSTGSGDG
mmetsp:Transcript_23314/g.33919  ORF Transcript_23314/g.33919 Transcript_23314/m.33919 type:complete len:642 (+) Transcript_23314:278-2203(+)